MEEKVLEELKWDYNHFLTRYKNGCQYLEKHPKQINKWLGELTQILENINVFLIEIKKHQEVSDKEILEGFDI